MYQGQHLVENPCKQEAGMWVRTPSLSA